jgi:hypothetical protein
LSLSVFFWRCAFRSPRTFIVAILIIEKIIGGERRERQTRLWSVWERDEGDECSSCVWRW